MQARKGASCHGRFENSFMQHKKLMFFEYDRERRMSKQKASAASTHHSYQVCDLCGNTRDTKDIAAISRHGTQRQRDARMGREANSRSMISQIVENRLPLSTVRRFDRLCRLSTTICTIPRPML